MNRRTRIFVHASFLKALLSTASTNHTRAMQILEKIVKEKISVFTSYLSVVEVFHYLQTTRDTNIALLFMQAILSSNIGILFPSKRDLNLAHRYIKMNQDKNIDCLEALNSIYMQRIEIEYILTFEAWNDLLGTSVSPLIASAKCPELSVL